MEKIVEKELPSLKELVKENSVTFSHYRQDNFYYNVNYLVLADEVYDTHYDKYQFPVGIDDIGTSTLLAEDKAIFFMRWIRQAIHDHTLIKI